MFHKKCKQDDSNSDEEDNGSTVGSRRFFTKKRRSTASTGEVSSALSIVEGQQHHESRLRRMSNVMSRRSRTSSTTSEVGPSDGGIGTTDSATAPREGSTMVGSDSRASGALGDAPMEEEEKLPPPFTMALAVMLSGLRVFLVDQVR